MAPITPPPPQAQKGPWPGGTWNGECGALATVDAQLMLSDATYQSGEIALCVRLKPIHGPTTIRCVKPFRHKGEHSPIPDNLTWSD